MNGKQLVVAVFLLFRAAGKRLMRGFRGPVFGFRGLFGGYRGGDEQDQYEQA